MRRSLTVKPTFRETGAEFRQRFGGGRGRCDGRQLAEIVAAKRRRVNVQCGRHGEPRILASVVLRLAVRSRTDRGAPSDAASRHATEASSCSPLSRRLPLVNWLFERMRLQGGFKQYVPQDDPRSELASACTCWYGTCCSHDNQCMASATGRPTLPRTCSTCGATKSRCYTTLG